MITIALVCILLAFLINYVIKLQWKLTYWKRLGVPQMTHNILDTGDQFNKVYRYLRAKGLRYGGSYIFIGPQFVPADLDLIKDIVQTNFSHFVNHGTPYDEEKDPLSANLFNLENERWRNMRVKLTPTFTSGKMKIMFQTVVDATPGLVNICKKNADNHEALEIKDVLARFTTDVIGSIAFGVECNCIENPNSDFRKYGNRVFEKIGYKMLLRFFCPKYLQPLFLTQPPPTEKTPSQFFKQVVEDLIQYREKNNIHRNDFLQLLLQIKNKGSVDGDVADETIKKGNTLTVNEIAAQCFVFFLGGFETTSTTMTFALYELSIRQDIQEKLRKNIIDILENNGSIMSYDNIMKMDYLDKVLNETLRLHPPVRFLPRKCTRDYQVPDSDFVVKKGTSTMIPIEAIHRDPEYYPDPEEFDPERFSPENKATRHQMAFIPFGEGPRMCIGLRFAHLQAKIGLVSLLTKFRVKINNKTTLPIIIEPNFTVNNIKGGLWLNFENLE